MSVATEQGREGPFPANVDTGLMRNAGWTEGIAYSPASKSFALMRNISEAQKQCGARVCCRRVRRSSKCSLLTGVLEKRAMAFRYAGEAPVERVGNRKIRVPALKADHELL